MIRLCWAIGICFLGIASRASCADYDPLTLPKMTPKTLELSVVDSYRKRTLPVLVYLPETTKPAPVVIFSHGLGGSCKNNPYLGKHWAARGYVCVFVQHPGSDESVWKETPLAGRMNAMKKAANTDQFMLRIRDIPVLIDELEKWNKKEDHPLFKRCDLDHIGMSGHSFGAKTTQAVSGEKFPIGSGFTDKRIKSAIMMSPSAPTRGDANKAFGEVKLPWLCMTGTHDTSIIGAAELKDRLAVYPALATGDKFELVLHEAEHSAFSDTALPGDKIKRNPNHHRAILATSTAFWDATLKQDADAKTWLTSEKVRTVLDKEDTWKHK